MVWGRNPHDGVISQLNSDGTALIDLGTKRCDVDLEFNGRPDSSFWQTDFFWLEEQSMNSHWQAIEAETR